jgi:uncharacterized membrane protein (DUF485 family)
MVAALDDADRKRRVRRTALWLALLAFAVYIGFIALAMVRGS